ncbi:MAG: serine hydrolase, partial [Arenimonas sp.]
PYTRKGFVDVFKNEPLQFVPGEKFKYSNSGYYLLGLIIERTSKKSYAEFLHEEIFAPLGMKNSGMKDPRALVPDYASGYYWSLNSFIKPAYMHPVSAFANGGMYSTVGDLLVWDAALYSDKLVSRKSLDEIFTPYKNEYGYGWRISKKFDRTTTEHSGSSNGFSTFILRFPSERLTVIVLSNSDSASATKAAYNLAAIAFGEPVNLPKPQLREVMTATLLKDGLSAAIQQYRELRRTQSKEYDLSEEVLIDLGYDLLDSGRTDDAIEVFKLGVEFSPKSSDFHDSLGHAYIAKGDRDLAIRSFEKVMEIEPDSEHGTSMLKDLRENGIKN